MAREEAGEARDRDQQSQIAREGRSTALAEGCRNWVLFSDSQETYDLMTLFHDPPPVSLLPAERPVAGWELHPLEITGFHGAQYFDSTPTSQYPTRFFVSCSNHSLHEVGLRTAREPFYPSLLRQERGRRG